MVYIIFDNGKEHMVENRIAFLSELALRFAGVKGTTMKEWREAISDSYHVQSFVVGLIHGFCLQGVVYTPKDRDNKKWGMEIYNNAYPY